MIVDEMLQAFEGRVDIAMPPAWDDSYSQLLKSSDASLREKADQIAIIFGDKRLLPRMREILSSPKEPLAARTRALEVLLRGRDRLAAPALIIALEQPELRNQAIRALANYDNPKTPSTLLTRYSEFDVAARRDVISTLTSRPKYARALLDAIENKIVTSRDVHAYHVRQLRSFDDPFIEKRIQEVWGTLRESPADKRAKISQYKEQLSKKELARADLSNGRIVFNKTCASCHKLFGEGYDIGPDITGSNRANLDYILENAVDPSSIVSNDYQMTSFALADGRVVTGKIQNETESAFTVRTVNDELLIPKADVEDRTQSALSLMPEGQLDQLSKNEVRDLIAYLASPSQVSLPRIALPIDPSTGKVTGAFEGETLKVVGKSDGTARGQDMNGFKPYRWSGKNQLWWTGQKAESQLDLEVSAQERGEFTVEVVLSLAATRLRYRSVLLERQAAGWADRLFHSQRGRQHGRGPTRNNHGGGR